MEQRAEGQQVQVQIQEESSDQNSSCISVTRKQSENKDEQQPDFCVFREQQQIQQHFGGLQGQEYVRLKQKIIMQIKQGMPVCCRIRKKFNNKKQAYYKKIFDQVSSKKLQSMFAPYLGLSIRKNVYYQYCVYGKILDDYNKKSLPQRLIVFKEIVKVIKKLDQMNVIHLDIRIRNLVIWKGDVLMIDLQDVFWFQEQLRQQTFQLIKQCILDSNHTLFFENKIQSPNYFAQFLQVKDATQEKVRSFMDKVRKISLKSVRNIASLLFKKQEHFIQSIKGAQKFTQFISFSQEKLQQIEFCVVCQKVRCYNHSELGQDKHKYSLSFSQIFDLPQAKSQAKYQFMNFKKPQFSVALKNIIFSQKISEQQQLNKAIETKIKIWKDTAKLINKRKSLFDQDELQQFQKQYDAVYLDKEIRQFLLSQQGISSKIQEYIITKLNQVFKRFDQYHHYYGINQYYLKMVRRLFSKNIFKQEKQVDNFIAQSIQVKGQQQYKKFLSQMESSIQEKYCKRQKQMHHNLIISLIKKSINTEEMMKLPQQDLTFASRRNYRNNIFSFANLLMTVIRTFLKINQTNSFVYNIDQSHICTSTYKTDTYLIDVINNIFLNPRYISDLKQQKIHRLALKARIKDYLFDQNKDGQIFNQEIIQLLFENLDFRKRIEEGKEKIKRSKLNYDQYCLIQNKNSLQDLIDKIEEIFQNKTNQYNLIQLRKTLKILFQQGKSSQLKQFLKDKLLNKTYSSIQSYAIEAQQLKRQNFWRLLEEQHINDKSFQSLNETVKRMLSYCDQERQRYYLYQNMETQLFSLIDNSKSIVQDIGKSLQKIQKQSLKIRMKNPKYIQSFLHDLMKNYETMHQEDCQKGKVRLLEYLKSFADIQKEGCMIFDIFISKNLAKISLIQDKLQQIWRRVNNLNSSKVNSIYQQQNQKLSRELELYRFQFFPISTKLDDKIKKFIVSQNTIDAMQSNKQNTFKEVLSLRSEQQLQKIIQQMKIRFLKLPNLSQISISKSIFNKIDKIDQTFFQSIGRQKLSMKIGRKKIPYINYQLQRKRSINIDFEEQTPLQLSRRMKNIQNNQNITTLQCQNLTKKMQFQLNFMKIPTTNKYMQIFHLTLNKCQNIDEQRITALTGLVSLNLCDITYKNQYFTGQIFKKMHRLVKLSILENIDRKKQYCGHYKFELKKLQLVTIQSCPFLTSKFIHQIIQNNKYQLRKLDLKSSQRRSINISINFPFKLQQLSLENFNIQSCKFYQSHTPSIRLKGYQDSRFINYHGITKQKYFLENCSEEIRQKFMPYCI